MKILCVIPARSGSKGVPCKNIRMINGKPLLAYAIESAISSQCFDKIVVSTEEEKIATIAKQYGAEVPFYRPKDLAQDETTSDDVILHVLEELKQQGQTFDVVVLRDCTVPFIDENDIQGAIKLFSNSSCDAVFCAIMAHPNPYFGMMEPNEQGFLIPSKVSPLSITRRQNAPVVFDVDGMFILDVQNFLKTKKISSGKIIPYEISKEHGHMIDFEFDFKVAELLMKEKS
ncbi:cytidylyltransferase domain-containing protein [Nitrosopumilus sp.]|uniref:acylneuraminate cytidylyltransferase family protein n=1 Tax=Nitrosopumilus sp. TaxID=2024843 RepID=UPI003D0B378F